MMKSPPERTLCK